MKSGNIEFIPRNERGGGRGYTMKQSFAWWCNDDTNTWCIASLEGRSECI